MAGCSLHFLLLRNIFVKKTDFHNDLSNGRLKDWLAESRRDTVCETAKRQDRMMGWQRERGLETF